MSTLDEAITLLPIEDGAVILHRSGVPLDPEEKAQIRSDWDALLSRLDKRAYLVLIDPDSFVEVLDEARLRDLGLQRIPPSD